VNAISAGPVKTLSAAGISRFREMLGHYAERAPLRRNITAAEVGEAAAFLLSPAASGITATILHVDAGYHAVGV
jgi:enoyl-[acyl-carrier protein] reductase I